MNRFIIQIFILFLPALVWSQNEAPLNLIWTGTIGKASGGFSQIKVDSENNTYMVGSFGDAIEIDPTSGSISANVSSSAFMYSYVIKIDSSGNLVWYKILEAIYYVGVTDLIVLHSGNILLVGAYIDSVDFDPGINSYYECCSQGELGSFLLELDPNGEFVDVVTFGGTNGTNKTISIKQVKQDSNGNIIGVGTIKGTFDFDPGPSSELLAGIGINGLKLICGKIRR